MTDKYKKQAFNEAIGEDSPENVDRLNLEVKADQLGFELEKAKKQNKALRKAIKDEKNIIETLLQLQKIETIPKIVVPKTTSKKPPASAVALFSDAHVEEKVAAARVNDLNFYDLEEAKRRVENFFVKLVNRLNHEQQYWHIDNLLLALLGDYITRFIHEEFKVNNFLTPTEATFYSLELIMSGLDYLLDKAPVEKITLVCCYGNHGRDVKYEPHSIKARQSYEWLLYQMLRLLYRKQGEDRLEFNIAAGTLVYHDIGDFRLRFNHGDTFNYRGGLGGVTIPMYGAINNWNKSIKADLDCMGHWHQFKDFGNAIINGSVIGYSEFAVDIRAEFEEPKQAFFLINSERNAKDTVHPIWVK